MNGTIISFDAKNGRGLIRGSDGHRYVFTAQDLFDATVMPMTGQSVDFECHGQEAKQIAVLNPPKQINITGLSSNASDGTILGGLSTLFAVLSLLWGFGIVLAMLGLITGFFGRRQSKTADNPTGKLLSLIGLVISFVILLVQIISGAMWTSLLFGVRAGGLW